MITHTQIARRFKAGASIYQLAMSLWNQQLPQFPMMSWAEKYVETAIRQVMKRQHAKHYGRKEGR